MKSSADNHKGNGGNNKIAESTNRISKLRPPSGSKSKTKLPAPRSSPTVASQIERENSFKNESGGQKSIPLASNRLKTEQGQSPVRQRKSFEKIALKAQQGASQADGKDSSPQLSSQIPGSGITGIPQRSGIPKGQLRGSTSSSRSLELEIKPNDTASPRVRRKLPSAPTSRSIQGFNNNSTSNLGSGGNVTEAIKGSKAQRESYVTESINGSKAQRESDVTESINGSKAQRESNVTESINGGRTQRENNNDSKPEISSSDTLTSNVNIDTSQSKDLKSRKTSDSDVPKSKGLLSNIKYNSLPRRRPSKTRSKFYLDVEGEQNLPTKTESQSLTDVNGIPSNILREQLNRKNDILKSPFKSEFRQSRSKKSDNSIFNKTDKTEIKQTHIALYKFIPRHKDELQFEEGDPINVIKIHDDLWYEGINLLSGKQGFFPSRYAADILADSEDGELNHHNIDLLKMKINGAVYWEGGLSCMSKMELCIGRDC